MMKNTIYNCNIIEFKRIHFKQGNLSVVENGIDVPFDINRIFYLYDIPGGESRGAHAHKTCHQILIAASGSFEVLMDDGRNRRIVQLNRPFMGLHIPPGIWASEINFSSGSICLVLASHKFDESDYIRDYDEFKKYKK